MKDRVDLSDELADVLRLIEVAAYRPGHHLEVIMDHEKGQPLAFLAANR